MFVIHKILPTGLMFLLLALATRAGATGVQNLSIDSSCIASNGSVQVNFDALINSWQSGSYAIAISANNTPDAGDSWHTASMNGSCPGNGYASGGGGGDNPQVLPQSRTINTSVPDGNYFLIVIVESNGWIGNCNGGASMSVPIQIGGCASPTPTFTPTPTITPTPNFTLIKSANVTNVSVGDTITFCIDWNNPSSSPMTRTFYDQLLPEYTFLGADSNCSAAGQLVTCSFPAAAYSSGTKCLWVEVNSVP